MKKKYFCISALAVLTVLLLLVEFWGLPSFLSPEDETAANLIEMALTRGLAGIGFIFLVWYMEYKVLNPLRRPFFKSLLFCAPAFAVAINNTHIYTLITGRERVTAGVPMVLLLALECFCVALFEEMAFRGVAFLLILENKRKSVWHIVLAIIISSAIFGVIHSVNLFTSSPAAVIMQIGYSFLVGAMCSVVLVRTANIWLCVLIHAIFNFGGALVPTLGEGFAWDAPTIVITVVIAVLTTAYMIVWLAKAPMSTLDRIYPQKKEEDTP